MKCPKDNEHEVVKNTAMGKEFYYCRGCKDEVEDNHDNLINLYADIMTPGALYGYRFDWDADKGHYVRTQIKETK